jgi:hypothetical protein
VTAAIDYLCVSEKHQVPEDAVNPVIRHDGGWGYCPAAAAAEHDWYASGGWTLATVREWMKRPGDNANVTRGRGPLESNRDHRDFAFR